MSVKQCVVLSLYLSLLWTKTEGQLYHLTGSSQFAVLGEDFTWTCQMFIPPGATTSVIIFVRNGVDCGVIGLAPDCKIFATDPRYTYECKSESIYTLTIPAENMTESEQASVWRCEYPGDSNMRSPDVTLSISIDVYNVSLIPSDNPLTTTDGTQIQVWCVVNSNAFPAPAITWYLGSTNITSTVSNNTASINITGNRSDNSKTLECRASNNDGLPKITNTTLNIEYPPSILKLTQQSIVEGQNLSVNCLFTPGNPRLTTLFWTKLRDSGIRQSGNILQLSNIRRNESGTYICTAENTYSSGGKGRHSQMTVVNVLYPPYVSPFKQQNTIEGQNLSVACFVTPGNPNITSLFWTNSNNPGFRQKGATLWLHNIRRNSSGTYRCTAENTYSIGNRGTHSQDIVVNVLYPPSVSTFSQQHILQGQSLSVTCNAIPGNPNSTTYYWTNLNDPAFRQDGAKLQLHNIQRNSSGTYTCTAENAYSNGEKGTSSQNMIVNVLYKPVIKNTIRTIVNESERVVLIREIDSNPLSDTSWYDGTELLKTETSVAIANLTIEHALCTDTKNFTLSASNAVQRNVTSMVELIVNCKPKVKDDEITLAITNATRRVSLSTTVIAYPEPRFNLKYMNGTINNEMIVNLYMKKVNNFTIYCEQQFVKEIDSVTYSLEVGNFLGTSTIFVHILKQEKPSSPIIIEAVCEKNSASIKWKSSVDGGVVQFYFVVALGDAHQTEISDTIVNKGDNQTLQTVVPFLQPSVLYTFYVFAKNSNGVTSSQPLICTTSKETQETSNTSNQTWEVVGSVAGVLVVLTLVIVFSCVVHRHYILSCQIGLQKRRNKPTETADLTEDKSPYTVIMSEQGDESGRNPYDALTTNDNANQYEAIKMNGNERSNANTYECLNKAVSSNPPTDKHMKVSNTQGTSKKTHAKYFSRHSEEYINTSLA